MDVRKLFLAALAGTFVLAGTSVYAATACQSATVSDFDNSKGNAATSLSTWLGGTDGGADDFFTVSNGTSMCEFSELGGAPNDNESNVDDFFTSLLTSGSWEFKEKEDGSYTNSGLLQSSANASYSEFDEGGNWSISDAFFDLYEYALLVFKDGNNEPGTFVAYKVEQAADGDVSGTWQSMWFNQNGLTGDGTSHISLYGYGKPSDPPGGVIPLPAGLPLLLTVVGIGGLIGRRKRKSA